MGAAAELFLMQGYASTGLSEVAKRADARPGSIYHFFPTKEDLLAGVLEMYKARIGPDLLEPVWSGVDDPIERVYALLNGYRQMLVMMEFAQGCPIGNLALEVCESHPNTRKLLQDNFDNWLRAVARCFRDAGGRLPAEADPERLAIFVLTTMEGAVMLARTYRDLRAYDAAISSLRDYIERLIRAETSWDVSRS